MAKKIIFGILVFLIAINLVSATITTSDWQTGWMIDENGNGLTAGNLTIKVSSTNSCDGDVLTQSFIDPFFTVLVNGSYYAGFFNVSLTYDTNYNQDYYVCHYFNGTQLHNPEVFKAGQGEINSSSIVTATPSNGDDESLSTANQIFDWVSSFVSTYFSTVHDQVLNTTSDVLFSTVNATNFTASDSICFSGSCISSWNSVNITFTDTVWALDNDTLRNNSGVLEVNKTKYALWTNDSGTAQYNGNVNMTGNVTVGTLELNSDEKKSPLSYFGESSGTDSPSVAQFYINTSLNPAYPFDFKAHVNGSVTGNAGVLIQRGQIGTFADSVGIQLIEGIRFIIDADSVAQTQGTRTLKGINNEFNDAGQTGGTYNAYGTYNDFKGRSYTGGSGTANQYGFYSTFGQDTSFAGTTTKNEYGIYINSIADFFTAGTGKRWGIYLDGYDKGANEQDSYAIWVDDGLSRFDDVNITTDLYANSNTLSSCGWEGNATKGEICGSGKIMSGYNDTNKEMYCCEL